MIIHRMTTEVASSVNSCPDCDPYFNEFSAEDLNGDETVDSDDLEDFDDESADNLQDMDVIRDYLEGRNDDDDDRNIYALPRDILAAESDGSTTIPEYQFQEVDEPYANFNDTAEQFRTSSFKLHDQVHSLAKDEVVCNEHKFIEISSELLLLYKSHTNMMETIIDINHKLAKKNDELTHCLRESKMMNEKISDEIETIQKQLHEERKNKRSILRIFRL